MTRIPSPGARIGVQLGHELELVGLAAGDADLGIGDGDNVAGRDVISCPILVSLPRQLATLLRRSQLVGYRSGGDGGSTDCGG